MALIINPNKHAAHRHWRNMSRRSHKHVGCCFRPVSGSASDEPLHLCPRSPENVSKTSPENHPRTPHHPRPPHPPLSLHPNTQRRPTKRIGQTSVCIVAAGYTEWQGFGHFVGCKGPLENFYWVAMVMRVKEHNSLLHGSACVDV